MYRRVVLHTRDEGDRSRSVGILREQKKKEEQYMWGRRSVMDNLCHKINPRPLETLP